ncbi:MAG: DUF1523 family protein [Pseudomonadota bacterium]
MWYYVKWGFWLTVLAIFSLFLNYTLASRDIVYITETEVEFTKFGMNRMFYSRSEGSADANEPSRDVKIIRAVRSDGESVINYRNEDTGLIRWPPYGKTNSADLQARAASLVSTAENPKWVIVRHYGWRLNYPVTSYPNALKITPVDDPNQRLIPWWNILIIIGLAALIRAVQVRLWRFFGRLFGRDRTQTV